MYKVSIYKSFEDLPPSFEALFEKSSVSTGVFFSLPWFKNLAANVFDAQGPLRVYAMESNNAPGTPLLVLPMRLDSSTASFLARRDLRPAANYYSSLFGPVLDCASPGATAYLAPLAKAIAQDRPRWDTVDLHPMAKDSAVFSSTINAFRDAGMFVQSYFCFGNWYLDVAGRSYDEYFDTLPSALKNLIKRKSKRLEKSGRLRLDIVTGGANLDSAIDAFEKIYNQSWKKPEPHPEFIPGLIRSCAKLGWLRLGLAYVDDVPAAAQLWIITNGVASIYKLAYDEKYSDLSVGSILTAKLMQHVIDVDRVREVDYLTGDDSYKKDWMSHRRERWGIVIFNLRTLHGLLAAARHVGGRVLKNMMERIKRNSSPAMTPTVEA
ncbi:GNAT family N-acetyltransferase [Noviherbaspirillum sp. ST9]|uniref:GNAT family N-acetyltransferase n=1 Tax=Noviherbaspirillum sp. ST9 TaxID=3401606 RepID=UPI003B58B15E